MTNNEIELIIYCRDRSDACLGLLDTASHLFPRQSIHLYRTCGEFTACMDTPGMSEKIAVILIQMPGELEGFLTKRDRLRRHLFVLVLPHTGQDLMIPALTLRPRYIGTIQDKFTDVYQVLEKLTIHHTRRITYDRDYGNNSLGDKNHDHGNR